MVNLRTLPWRLRLKADMINMGERIEWGSETALMSEAADEIERLEEKINELEVSNKYLEEMRPHWAKGYTSDGVAAQTSFGSLNALWELLGVNNQTDAVIKLRLLVCGNAP